MAYGTDAGTMALAYGGSKTVTPSIVGEARQKATTIINGYLNRTSDFSSIPTMVNDCADWIASEYIKKKTTPLADLVEMANILLGTIKDDLNVEEGTRWGNMEFV